MRKFIDIVGEGLLNLDHVATVKRSWPKSWHDHDDADPGKQFLKYYEAFDSKGVKIADIPAYEFRRLDNEILAALPAEPGCTVFTTDYYDDSSELRPVKYHKEKLLGWVIRREFGHVEPLTASAILWPNSSRHIGNQPVIRGVRFPDGTVQTNEGSFESFKKFDAWCQEVHKHRANAHEKENEDLQARFRKYHKTKDGAKALRKLKVV